MAGLSIRVVEWSEMNGGVAKTCGDMDDGCNATSNIVSRCYGYDCYILCLFRTADRYVLGMVGR